MYWFIQTCKSSLGKKYIMAFTGLMLGSFLLIHAAGNSTIIYGRKTFLSYAEHLHGLGPLVPAAEITLLFFFLLHVITGVNLFLQNLQARSKRYAVSKTAGGRTLGSSTMPYTGVLILAFILVHLLNMRFTGQDEVIADTVSNILNNPIYTVIYLAGISILALHITHGFWSLFQTLGINHPRYNRLIRLVSYLLCGMIIVVFAIIIILLISSSGYLS